MATTSINLREIELSLAYEEAACTIASFCPEVSALDLSGDSPYYNAAEPIGGTDQEVREAVAYLDSRRLISRAVDKPDWVCVLDEGEPLHAPTWNDVDEAADEAEEATTRVAEAAAKFLAVYDRTRRVLTVDEGQLEINSLRNLVTLRAAALNKLRELSKAVAE